MKQSLTASLKNEGDGEKYSGFSHSFQSFRSAYHRLDTVGNQLRAAGLVQSAGFSPIVKNRTEISVNG